MKLVTAATAAKQLGVTASRIRQLAIAGRIKGAARLGRDWVMPSPVKVSKVQQGRPPKD